MNHESFCKKVFCLATATAVTVYVTARVTDCLMHHFFQYCSVYLPRTQGPCAFPHDLEEAAQAPEEQAEHPVAG
ncbi:MAG: hypothetical protein IJA78_01525 [Clostridia bacterium]|nr:hypothetical protein [Clostridia bacterium]